MKAGNNKIFLTYCLNLHSGESMEEVGHALFVSAPSILRHVVPQGDSCPVGPWFNSAVARKLLEPGNLSRLRQQLDDAGLFAVTLNGFPYSSFHGKRVKEQVYLPDWSSQQRLDYTLDLKEILSHLLPKGVEGSISTLPVGYASLCSRETLRRSAENMAQCAWHFYECAQETGRKIILSIEPEPDCVVGDMVSFLRFYNDSLLCEGQSFLETRHGVSSSKAEGIIREHVGICIDTVHAAVVSEDIEEWLERFHAQGIKIGKIQLGAALRAEGPDFSSLRPFDDPVYLHQTRYVHGRSVKKYADLGDFLSEVDGLQREGYAVVHYHMPFTWKGTGALSSCHSISSKFLEKAVDFGVSCFELEIYTLSVFPEFMAAEGEERESLISGIMASELLWLRGQFGHLIHTQEA